MPDTIHDDDFCLYRYPFGEKVQPACYTQGVKDLIDTHQAHWLLDAIMSYQFEEPCRSLPFQVWKLSVNLDKKSAVLTGAHGDGTVKVTQDFWITDYPEAEAVFWIEHSFQNWGGKVADVATILLPSEH